MTMAYFCCDERRRGAVSAAVNLNGIDFLEVIDRDAARDEERQRILHVHFLRAPAPAGLVPANVEITGGERITAVRATAVAYDGDVLVVSLDRAGDFSRYQLRLVQADGSGAVLDGLDPLLATVDFSFKVECPDGFDCSLAAGGTPAPVPAPDIDYLAKDYASFRQLILDRLAVLLPGWTERNAADLGVTLAELLAYVGDYLSYRQDAVATEAYLGTARSRVSVRRHARLVDYPMHEGCNARVWVQIDVQAPEVTLPKGTQLLTGLEDTPTVIPPASHAYTEALSRKPVIFETLHDARLSETHNALSFYTWGDARCRLPAGATTATLLGHHPLLRAGDVLIVEEVLGPATGRPDDADPARRHALRLTSVTVDDARGSPLTDPLTGQPITEIGWGPDDKLPFPFHITARIRSDSGEADVVDVTIVRGNVVLADQGMTVTDEAFERVPDPTLFRAVEPGGDCCAETRRQPVPPRFRPQLRRAPLTFAANYDPASPPPSAGATLNPGPERALPGILRLIGQSAGRPPETWVVRPDLLGSDAESPDFVVETESDGRAFLRFGDGRHGRRPPPGTAFVATYRVGNGPDGNIGSEALAHIVTGEAAIERVRNPLPALGGVAPESLEHVRQHAPFAFRTQQRAVTASDYAAVASTFPQVQRAAATLRWTGSWQTVFVTADRLGGIPVDDGFESALRRYVEPFRMAGQDVEVDGPQFVPLEIDMQVCVQPGYFASDVKAALLAVFSSGRLPDGRRGAFHPDNFSFGQTVYLSPLYALAQTIDGVASVQISRFHRQGLSGTEALDSGKLELGHLEIAQLDNDPNFPERGVFRLTMRGGQ